MDARFQAEAVHRLDEELAQLGRAFVVAPVADPHQVALAHTAGDWTEYASVGGFMPCPGLARPAMLLVQVADHAAKREHAVVVTQVVCGHAAGLRDAAMVRVVKEQPIPRVVATMLADALDQR